MYYCDLQIENVGPFGILHFSGGEFYKFSDPDCLMMNRHTKFQHSRAKRGRVIYDSANFTDSFISGDILTQSSSS